MNFNYKSTNQNVNLAVVALIIAKILVFFLFSSDYSNQLFIPFLNRFIGNLFELNFVSPWSLDLNQYTDAFPYHPSMLYVYGFFQLPSYLFSLDLYWQKLFFVLPTLAADFLIYLVLLDLFPIRRKAILIFYFCSPIVIYSIYAHGQLDLWPTALMAFSIHQLLKDRLIQSAILLGFALTFKVHIVSIFPLILFYIYKKTDTKITLRYFFVTVVIYFVITLPWLFDEGFRSMVILNPKQDLVWKVFYRIGDNLVYLSLMAIMIIYIRFLGYTKVNKDLLITWIAILFAVFVLLIPPAPGWYVWLIPYLMYFYLKYIKKNKQILILYSFFSFSYFLYFLFVWKGEHNDLLFLGQIVDLKIHNEKISGICYTILQTSLIANLYMIYKIGVRSNRIYTRPDSILIGIGGDSGAGKSTLLHALERLLSPSVTLLEGDGDHRWERGNENYEKMTHLNPRANYLERQAENLIRLKKGETIYRPDYDHHHGTFTDPLPILPTDFIILSGLHTFYLPKMRKVTDIKIFLDTAKDLRLHWKIIRDTTKRGYTKEKIESQLNEREGDSDKYIRPQRNFADLIIEYDTRDTFQIGSVDANPRIYLKLTISSEFHIENLILAMEEGGWLTSWDYGEDLRSQYFTFQSFPSEVELQRLASTFLPSMEEVLTPLSSWEESYLGIVQLFVLVMVNKKYLEVESV